MKKIFILLLCLLLVSCSEKQIASVDYDAINQLDFSDIQTLDVELHSSEYLLIDLSDFKVLYGKDYDKKIYPASLTKLMTLDVVLNCVADLNETSYVDYYQVQDLIRQDASLAYIQTNYDYSLEDLLYALILPSGADAAVAIENYFTLQQMDILEEMTKQLAKLDCHDTNFVNTTGLHDDNHYTTLNDLLKILMDILSYDKGREILEAIQYTTSDNKTLHSSLRKIRGNNCTVLGGKTGFTDESGQSVIILYKAHNRSYALFLANAMDERPNRENWHFVDAMEIMNKLY